jgi:hypothetical protein
MIPFNDNGVVARSDNLPVPCCSYFRHHYLCQSPEPMNPPHGSALIPGILATKASLQISHFFEISMK